MKAVTPAEAGVQNYLNSLDSRFRGNDEKGTKRTFYEAITFDDLVKSRQRDDFVKSSPAFRGTRRAKPEE